MKDQPRTIVDAGRDFGLEMLNPICDRLCSIPEDQALFFWAGLLGALGGGVIASVGAAAAPVILENTARAMRVSATRRQGMN